MAVVLFTTAAAFLAGLIGFVSYLKGVGLDPDADEASRGGTILFTAFVLLQFWNLFNARALGRGGSALGGLGSNPWFLLIAAAIMAGQFLIVQFGGAVFRTVPLDRSDWVRLIGGTAFVLVAGEVIRLTTWLRRRTAAAPSPSASPRPSP
jgi:Ca2+-transporting ATPase